MEAIHNSERAQKALDLHHAGYNCCQAVACAYCDLLGVQEDAMFKAAEGFGAGMGGMQGTCGAVSAAVLLAGFLRSGGPAQRTKQQTYALSRAITQGFCDKNGTLTCAALKGVDTGAPLRSCDGCIADACALVEEILFPAAQ